MTARATLQFAFASAALVAFAPAASAEPVPRPVALTLASSFKDAPTLAAEAGMRSELGKSKEFTVVTSAAPKPAPTLMLSFREAAKVASNKSGEDEMTIVMIGGWSDGAISRTFIARCAPSDPAICGRAGAIWAGKYLIDRDHGE
jgi:hypothetical protein